MFKVCLALALISAASANTRVQFTACPGNLPVPLWVESNFCTATRCTLTRGQVWTGRTEFRPVANFNTLQVDLSAYLAGIRFPIDIPAGYEDACHFLEGASCPVTPNNNYIWAIQAPVAATYPAAQGVTLQRKLTLN